MDQKIAFSSSLAFEQAVATRLRADFLQGWIVHDVYAGEEQIDVLTVLPHGVFALECKVYSGQIVGDPNTAWGAWTRDKTIVLDSRHGTPYRQVLRKAFAVGDVLTAVMQTHLTCGGRVRPWVHACVVVPHAADVSTFRGIAVNFRRVVPRGQGRASVCHPDHVAAYITLMGTALDQTVAEALVRAFEGTVESTWTEQHACRQESARLSLLRRARAFVYTSCGTREDNTTSGHLLTLRSIWQMDEGTDGPRVLTLVPD